MKAGKETEMYNQGYMDGYNDGENARIDPDYWTRLEHTYAGMAMQGILTNPIGFESIRARGFFNLYLVGTVEYAVCGCTHCF